jgi:uncharacterized protein YbaP (TraB family)
LLLIPFSAYHMQQTGLRTQFVLFANLILRHQICSCYGMKTCKGSINCEFIPKKLSSGYQSHEFQSLRLILQNMIISFSFFGFLMRLGSRLIVQVMRYFSSSVASAKFFAFLLLGVFAFAGMLQAQNQPTSPKKYNSLLWEVTAPGGGKPSYLFGTMHVSSKLAFHLSDSFYWAIRSADVVALEMDPAKWQEEMNDQQQRQELVQKNSWNRPAQKLNLYSFQFPDAGDAFRSAVSSEPQLLNSLLYRSGAGQTDFEEDTYLDLHIFQTGKKFGKSSAGVENFIETERLMVQAYQNQLVEKRKKTADKERISGYEIQKKIQEAYRKGDLDALDSLQLLTQQSEAYNELFLYKRNEIQAKAMDSIMKSGKSVFTGVGAAHLPGDRGVIEWLRKMGYQLRPITMTDRDAKMKDKIDSMRVPVVMKAYEEDHGLFSVSVPEIMYRRTEDYLNNSWLAADMANGSYYQVSRIPLYGHLTGKSPAKMLALTDSLLYETIPGRILSIRDTLIQGAMAKVVNNRTSKGNMQRYLFIATRFHLWMFKMNGPLNYVEGPEGEAFFASIKLKQPTPKATADLFPLLSIPTVKETALIKNITAPDGMEIAEWSGWDEEKKIGYSVWMKNMYQFEYIGRDSLFLWMMDESLKKTEEIDKRLSRTALQWGPYPCWEVVYKLKNGTHLLTRLVLRNQQLYAFLASSTGNLAQLKKSAGQFFQQMKWNSVQELTTFPYTDSLLHFSASLPLQAETDTILRNLFFKTSDYEFLKQIPDYIPAQNIVRSGFFEFPTGEAIHLRMEMFPPYFSEKDSATFWKTELKSVLGYSFDEEEEEDEDYSSSSWTLTRKTPFNNQSDAQGYHLELAEKGARRKMRLLLVQQQNRLYKIAAISDSSEFSPAIERFFATFRALPKEGEKSIYEPKWKPFLADLFGTDSTAKKQAVGVLQSVKFTPESLPTLMHTIRNMNRSQQDYIAVKSGLIRKIGALNDPSSSPKAIDSLKTLMVLVGDTTAFQNTIMEALAMQKTNGAYAQLKAWMKTYPPVYNGYYQYSRFFNLLNDSLALAATLYPDLMELTSLEDYKWQIYDLLLELRDSAVISNNTYELFYPRLFADARMEWKKQQLMESQRADDKEPQNNKFQDSWGRISSTQAFRFARLLAPFVKKDPAVETMMKKLLDGSNARFQTKMAGLLLEQQVQVPDSVVQQLLKNDATRYEFIRIIDRLKMNNLIPSVYQSQQKMAISMLLSASDYKSFHAVEYVGTQWMQTEKKEGKVYFYKYKLLPDDDWMMGIVGLFDKNEKKYVPLERVVELTGKKIKKGTPESEQFEEQFIQMIFNQFDATESFFDR